MTKKIIEALDKAVIQDIIIYDMKSSTPFYDYAIIGTAKNARQGQASMGYIRKMAETEQFNLKSIHGVADSTWYLADLGNIIVHVFVGDDRQHYGLDQMYEMSNNIK